MEEPTKRAEVTPKTADDLSIDENGEVSVSDTHVIGIEPEIFGENVYNIQPGTLEDIVPPPADPAPASTRERLRETIADAVTEQVIKPALDQVKQQYGDSFRKSDQKRVESKLNAGAEAIVHQHESEYHIEQKRLEQERDELLDKAKTEEERTTVQRDFQNLLPA